MREIKFRSWDGDKMFYDGDFSSCHICGSGSGYNSEYELMQFTGLKDKNGQEIYEGDIVRVFSKSYGVYLKAVGYSAECAGFIVTGAGMPNYNGVQIDMPEREWTKKHMPCNCDGAMYEGFGLLQHGNNLNLQVVGNIYENPELLEQEK